MLEIINEKGLVMELSAKTSIPVERNNSFFNSSNELIMDLSYPGQAPLTAKNKAFVNSGHRVYADATVYEFPVSVFLNSALIFAGIFNYKISNNQIDFIISPNFSAINKRANEYGFKDIKFRDFNTSFSTSAQIAAYMKLTVENPQDHPAVFIPVYNPASVEETEPPTAFRSHVNYWYNSILFGGNYFINTYSDIDQQAHFEAPFFRLNYMLQKACEFLGFTATGSVFTDPVMMKKCIYTRVVKYNYKQAVDRVAHLSSNLYMPDISIGEFLKAINARYGLSLDFNYQTKTATFHTFEYLLNQAKVHDLSNYIEQVTEIKTTETKGISIYLETDANDALYQTELSNGSFINVPTSILKIGNPDAKDTHLAVGTLKQRYRNSGSELEGEPISVMTRQLVVDENEQTQKIFFAPDNRTTGRGRGTNGVQVTGTVREEFIPQSDAAKSNLRIINYEGLVSLGGLRLYPKSTSDELNESDAKRFVFLHGSKQLKVIANIPSHILSEIKISDKIAFKTKEGDDVECLIEKMSYDLEDTSRTRVLFDLRTKSYTPAKFEIVPGIVQEDTDEDSTVVLSAYFSPTSGISKIEFEVYGQISESTTVKIPYKLADVVLDPGTDIYGVGGKQVSIIVPKEYAVGQTQGIIELRFHGAYPQYLENQIGTSNQVYTTPGQPYRRAFAKGNMWMVF
jgi:hypothetical protein